jgi:hypothetical protein
VESQSSNASSAATRRSGRAGLGHAAIVAGVEGQRRDEGRGWRVRAVASGLLCQDFAVVAARRP